MVGQQALAPAHGSSQARSDHRSGDTGRRQVTWSPDADVFERQGLFIVRMDLPGLSARDIRVDLTDDAITIAGERFTDSGRPGDCWQAEERPYGRFFRRVMLPDGARPAQARSRLVDGVLEITLPVASRRV